MLEEEVKTWLERVMLSGPTTNNNSDDDETLRKLRKVPLLQLSCMMSTYLTDEKQVSNALSLLARTTVGRDNLTNEEAEVVLKFFEGKLSTIQTVEAAVESIALVVKDLSCKQPCSEKIFKLLSDGFLQNVRFQALPNKVRRHGYDVLMFMVSKETLPLFTTSFLRLLLDAIDEESEPELVMSAFELHYFVGTYTDKTVIDPILDDYFDSLSSYFPVVFSQPPGCKVTREDLRRRLTKCLTRPLYLDSCVLFILSRLSSPSSVVKQESIDIILEIFSPNSEHEMKYLNSHVVSVVNHIRNEIVKAVSIGCSDNDSLLKCYMNVLTYIGKRSHEMSSSFVLSWLEPITSGFLASLNSSRVICSAYATMFYHLASSDVICGTTLAHYFLPLLFLNVPQQDDSNSENIFLIISALLTGIFDLRKSDKVCEEDSLTVQTSVRKSLEASSLSLFELMKKLLNSFNKVESPTDFIKCEVISSLLNLEAWMHPWMPEELIKLSYKKLISLCLLGDEEISRKIANSISSIGRVEGNVLNDILLNNLDNVDFTPTGVFALFHGLMVSSVSTALVAIEHLLNFSRVSFTECLSESDKFSFCREALSVQKDISTEKLLHLLVLVIEKDSVASFELVCEILLRLPLPLHKENLLQMINGRRLSVLAIALLSCDSDIFDIEGFSEHWVVELLENGFKEKFSRLTMQGISAICARSPSIADIFLEKSKDLKPEVQLEVYAAITRGLLINGVIMKEKVELITDYLLTSIYNGIDGDNALTTTFFYPKYSKNRVSLLIPLILGAQKNINSVPLNLLKIIVSLIKNESFYSDFNWSIVIEFTQKIAQQESSEGLVAGVLDLLDCILSRIDSRDFFMKFLVTDSKIFPLVISGIRSSTLQKRCISLNLLSEVALFASRLSTTGNEDEFDCMKAVAKVKEEVLCVTQASLADDKRVVRRAAAQCRHQWYKIK
ncbi:putative folate/biopterin transporter [Trypanosoma theileri]|uniref:MMS19 nucleotide excision repair protein n=1 Tax=Trypanosoma theileri TaxID=67003 RepID=A0A1X0NRK4_9TRYP|nr:putative folate/biopterin transporter [Trypanosoma theileri]ORC86809.1 putative folate/biopterin transporter [Trypanosoma theileri]